MIIRMFSHIERMDILFPAAMILMDNKFSSIPVAIELGRLVFDNLKKVALYLMPVSAPPFCCVNRIHAVIGWHLCRVLTRLL